MNLAWKFKQNKQIYNITEVDIVRVEEPEEVGIEEAQLDEMWSACQ